MEGLEVSARTVEEAIDLALAQLGMELSQVKIEVLSKGKSGILGFGAEDAVVRVSQLAPRSETASQALEVLEKLLLRMRISAVATLVEPRESTSEPAPLALDIKGQDLGILIGRRGETLAALQYLVNLIVSRHLKAQAGVVVDVEGYRERRYQALRSLVLRLAQRVQESQRSITMEPMPAAERRIVHIALRDHPDVTTQSIGEGGNRKVAIFLRRDPRDYGMISGGKP